MIAGPQNKAKPIFIIAEAGVNHNGSIKIAKKLIDVAARASADAVKFQTFQADKIISKYAPKAEYQKMSTAETESQLEMVKKLELTEGGHRQLIEYCQSRKIQFLSTPFDLESINLLTQKFALPSLKIPSGEITDAPFLLAAAKTGKNIILSTGMSTLKEVADALGVLAFGYAGLSNKPAIAAFKKAYYSGKGQRLLKEKVILLHCTTEYPAPFDEVNLKAMETLRKTFGLPVGLSDHTQGIAVSIAAAALGAAVIEKHFTLDRNLPGPDHKASLEPDELYAMIRSIRQVEKAMGSLQKKPTVSEIKNLYVARKSLVAAQPIHKGDVFSPLNLAFKRPGTGISPMKYWELLGKRSAKNYYEDELITK